MIDEKRLIDELENLKAKTIILPSDIVFNNAIKIVIDTINEQSKVNDWICFELDEDGILASPIPDDEQEILISDGDSVWFDTFINDLGECYLDSNVELIGLAWMPLPEPYGGEQK